MNDAYFIPILVSGGILFLIFLFFIIFYLFLHRKRLHLHFVEKEKMQYDYSMRVLKERLEEQERAMSQISREIHDNVAQNIDLLQMNMKALKESNAELLNNRALHNSFALVEHIGNDLRNISYSLNSDYVMAQGLAAVLQKEINYIMTSRQISGAVKVEGEEAAGIAPEQELLIYRIAQEALHNVVKHSGASEITVTIRYTPEHFRMRVADNGRGFDQERSLFMTGLGFKNMQHRANLLPGVLEIRTAPGEGCVVSLCMDLPENA